ncbi:MAG: hypothetical protein AAF290_04520 [Pseudomonadota bacterium]
MNKWITTGVLLMAALAHTSAWAQEGKIQLQTVVEKEQVTVAENGDERVELVPVEKVFPGDVVIYTVTYTNVADQAVENVTITNPISAELSYVPESAFAPGADVSFSVDGGKTFDALANLTVAIDGAERTASVEDLTHIRWVLTDALAPGSRGFARFRARLN